MPERGHRYILSTEAKPGKLPSGRQKNFSSGRYNREDFEFNGFKTMSPDRSG
jgi:hypothetical protein